MITPKRPMPDRRVAINLPVKTKRMTKGRWLALAAALLLSVGGVVWAVRYFGKDTRLADVIELREKMLDPSLSKEEKQALQDEVQRRMQAMMPELQKTAVQEGGAAFMQMMGAHMNEVLSLPPDKVMAAVDKDIDFMQSMSRMPGQTGKGGGPPGKNGAAKPPGGRPPGFPGWQGTDAQRAAFRNMMLSSIPADTRATFQVFRQLMQARAVQRGITGPQGGPR